MYISRKLMQEKNLEQRVKTFICMTMECRLQNKGFRVPYYEEMSF